MDIDDKFLEENFIKLLNLKTEKNYFTFRNSDLDVDPEVNVHIKNFDINDEVNYLKKCEYNDTFIYNNNYFEQLLIKPNDFLDFDNFISAKDKENNIQYEISYPSIEYILSCFYKLFKDNEVSSFFLARTHKSQVFKRDSRFIFVHMELDTYSEASLLTNKQFKLKSGNERDIFLTLKSILKEMFKGIITIKISSKQKIDLSTFKTLNNSFLFSLGYDKDISLMEFRQKMNTPPRFFESITISAPLRIYNEKLFYYYQQAISSQNPVLQYLSFYQIIENFHYEVSNEDIIKIVRDILTHPSFSYKNQKSIENVIKTSREWKFNEKNATKLVIEQLIDLNDLKTDLIEYDGNYYNYLKSKGVRFAHAKKIREDKETIEINSLSERVHNVRNALIHSKEGDLLFNEEKKGIYIPLTNHEEELVQEIPLIRMLAEHIMINTSEVINEDNLNYNP